MRNYIVTLFVLLFVISTSYAQTVNPDSLLNSSPPIINSPEADEAEDKSTEEKSTKDEAEKTEEESWDTEGWVQHTRIMTCHNMMNVRAYTSARGQVIILSGFKQPGYLTGDPFDGLIITQNPMTGEYMLLLVQVSTGLTCIVQMGTSIQTTQDIIDKLQKEQDKLESEQK